MQWESKKDNDGEDTLSPPKKLSDFGITSEKSVNNGNAQDAASYYGINIVKYEAQSQNTTKPFDNPVISSNKSQDDNSTVITIPEDFVANKINGHFNFNSTSGGLRSTSAHFLIHIDGSGDFQKVKDNKGSGDLDFDVNVNNLEGPITLRVSYRMIDHFSGQLIISCVSDPKFFDEWETNSFHALKEAYNDKLEEYNRKLEEQKAQKEAEKAAQEEENENTNPQINRITEQRELKRLSIEMIAHPYCYDFGKSFYDCKEYECDSDCSDNKATIPQINQNKELEDFAQFSQFFETVFDWDILSYTLFPYYYNEKCNWPELLQTKNSDPIFQAFLQRWYGKSYCPSKTTI